MPEKVKLLSIYVDPGATVNVIRHGELSEKKQIGMPERLTNVIYHLDGIGELCHLDSVLSLPELNAVQWVYGEGKPGPMHWLDVYKKIRAAGKRVRASE